MNHWKPEFGLPFPLGCSWNATLQGYNFALYSKEAKHVQLVFFHEVRPYEVAYAVELDPTIHKTERIWHYFIPLKKLNGANCYAYRIGGHQKAGNRFNRNKLLLDPWAKGLYFPPDFCRHSAVSLSDNTGKAPLAKLFEHEKSFFDWQQDKSPTHYHDLVIYELHVKGFTQQDPEVTNANRGKYKGVIEKIPYLQELGITAVELMPVMQYDPKADNYWGYMPMNFFSPHYQYSSGTSQAAHVREFKEMVRALHQAGIEVILDVVYNHTAEGDENGPVYSFKGIDNSSYYILTPELRGYINDTGTGNVLRTSYPYVRKLVLDSLRYWVEEMHVDGFRFDLASIMTRDDSGQISQSSHPVLEEISNDPVLSKVRLIAEPWDLTANQLGKAFPAINWCQWNGCFRDHIRQFVRGDAGLLPALMRRLYGSDDLFPDDPCLSYRPFQSINFVSCHDGFCLYDQVSYNEKHNQANGHDNRDGSNFNFSWNCGWEGEEGVPAEVMNLRKRQVKNFFTLLMLSNGSPMFYMGDEFLNTQFGNNNPYNQDNVTGWLDWNRKEKYDDIYCFVKKIIAFRKTHPTIGRGSFWRDEVRWFGAKREVDFSYDSRSLAFFLSGDRIGENDLYVMINAYWEPLDFYFQEGEANEWCRIIDTSFASPDDIAEKIQASPVNSLHYRLNERSVAVFERF